jgi:hypothetical protein
LPGQRTHGVDYLAYGKGVATLEVGVVGARGGISRHRTGARPRTGRAVEQSIAEAKDPIRMARAMKLAVEAGRESYLAGRMARRMYADPSSPLAGLI